MPVINLLADFCLCMTFALAFSISIRLASVIVSSIKVRHRKVGTDNELEAGKETSENYSYYQRRDILKNITNMRTYHIRAKGGQSPLWIGVIYYMARPGGGSPVGTTI